jgi:hypothetical protein
LGKSKKPSSPIRVHRILNPNCEWCKSLGLILCWLNHPISVVCFIFFSCLPVQHTLCWFDTLNCVSTILFSGLLLAVNAGGSCKTATPHWAYAGDV